jgi:hypothetical protein
MQKHAQLMGLGNLKNPGLAAEVRSQIGTDIFLTYSQPQPAGGVVTSATNYALLLRKILSKELLIGKKLGDKAVCTNPETCDKAVRTPIPLDESWDYSLGHWVETDPDEGDGAFSCAGAFGFYPWIDAAREYYGILARRDEAGTGAESMACGRLLRRAWQTGVPQ